MEVCNLKVSDYEKAETSNIDYKVSLEVNKPKSWLKSVSAFANTKGGIILFGVDDKTHELKGLNDIQKASEKITEIINSKILPLPRYEINTFIEENELNFDCWKANVEKIKYTKTKDKIKKMVNKYSNLIENDNKHKKIYEKLFFANLFLSYAENKKGEIALEILLDEELMSNIVIPSYIEEGIKWLVK